MKTSILYHFGSKYAKKSSNGNNHPLYLLNVKNIAIHAKTIYLLSIYLKIEYSSKRRIYDHIGPNTKSSIFPFRDFGSPQGHENIQ